VALWVVWVVRAGRGSHVGWRAALPRGTGAVLLVVAVAFGVLRNLPVGSALAP